MAENPKDPALLVVDDQTLTRSQIEQRLTQMKPEAGGVAWESLPPDVQENLLRGIATQFAISSAAAKKVTAEDPRIESRLNAMREQIRISLYTEDRLAELVTERKLRAAYSAFLKQNHGETTYQLLQIITPTEEEARMAKEDFAKGKPLSEIAASRPEWKSSDLGLIAESELLTAVADAVRPLKTGQVSAPVRTPFGWHVLLVMARQAAKAPTYEQMLPELTAELRRSEWQAHLAELLKKAKAATIEPDGKHRPLNLAPAAE